VYVPILAYHKVRNQFEWSITTVPIRAFESQIKYLAENNYYSISLKQYLDGASHTQRPIIITFDDADESVFLHAFPILKSYNFTATVFIISNYVGKQNTWDANLGGGYSRHLNWDQIMELSGAGWEIGSHTARHRDLLHLSSVEVKEELQSSKEIIERRINLPIHFLAYPFSRYDRRIISIAQQIGYAGGCALGAKKNLKDDLSHFNIQRYGVYAIDTRDSFKQKLAHSSIEKIKQRIISSASLGTIWYKRLRK
jgi:peptidoglycan/xylan/chitin deacetylase (PgdA/CDA1 family)